LIFLCDIVSLKPTIVLIICHFLTSLKFRGIPQQYQNSVEKGKFCGSNQNSAACGKLWALKISVALYPHIQNKPDSALIKLT